MLLEEGVCYDQCVHNSYWLENNDYILFSFDFKTRELDKWSNIINNIFHGNVVIHISSIKIFFPPKFN